MPRGLDGADLFVGPGSVEEGVSSVRAVAGMYLGT